MSLKYEPASEPLHISVKWCWAETDLEEVADVLDRRELVVRHLERVEARQVAQRLELRLVTWRMLRLVA